jgi:hypothetical protein
MALITWKFVDQPVSSPTVLLDMNNGTTARIQGLQMPAPPLKRSIATNAMTDGGIVSSAAYDLRELKFTAFLNGPDLTSKIAQLDALKRELSKPSNLLMFAPPGGSNPVFFQTVRSDDYLPDYQGAARAEWYIQCTVLAQPFAIGIRHDITSGLVVTNDPMATGSALNSNTSFETNTAGWTGIGGTLTRTTAQFHSGVASGTITPDGVTATVRIDSANVAVTGGATYRAQGWVRCAVARSISLNINWYDSGSNYITTGTGTISVAATTWTFIATDMIAPSNAAFGNIIPTMTGTPPATNVLWVDEVELRQASVNGATFFDVTGVRGDSPSPAFVRVALGSGTFPTFFWSQRTANNPPALTLFAQAEAGTVGTDTTVQANDTNMSGAGSNFVRTTFTTATLTTRLTVTVPTSTDPAALRGRYRVLAKVRMSAGGSNFTMRYVQNPAGTNPTNGGLNSFDSSAAITTVDLGIVEFGGPGATPATIGFSGLSAGFATQTLGIQIGRNSGTATLDMDYIYLLPADERSSQFRRANWAASSYLVIDGPQELAYGMASGTSAFGATRTVDNAGGLASYLGGFPMLVPGVTNRWYTLIGPQAASAASTWDVSYWPRWREVATS